MRVESRIATVARVHGNIVGAPRRLRRSALSLALNAGFGAAASLALLPSAQAQSAPATAAAAPASAASAAPKKADAQQLQTVVVTAEKKVASEQKTAISMSVFDAETLAAQGVSDLRSLSTLAPGLDFSEAGSGSIPILTVRGISSRDTTEIGDPAVSVNFDGTYTNRPYALSSSLYDLERVEFLRGPQGTLYGRNATGGALNIITAAPTKVFGGHGSVEAGNYRTLNVEGALNVPLSATVQMRAAASQRRHDGYLHNDAVQNAYDEDTRSARLSFAFQPIAGLSAMVTAETTSSRGVGQQPLMVPFHKDADGNVLHTGVALPDDPRRFPLLSPAEQNLDQNLMRWRVSYALPWVDLSYIGGYSKIDFHRADMQSSAAALQSFVINDHPKTWNHELRVAGKPGGALDWQAGLYHFKEDASLYSYEVAPGDAGTLNRRITFDYTTAAKSDAVYGQATYSLRPDLRLTAGLRHTKDEKSRNGTIFFNDSPTPPISYFALPTSASGSWSKTNYHAGVDWDLRKDLMLYAKFDTGYKAGGFTDIAPYGPENVRGFEIGSKGRMLDQRLQVNLAAFSYDYSGQQVSQNAVRENGTTGVLVLNAGKTKIYGAEASVVALAGAAGRISASLQYLHARFEDFVVARGSENVQLAGNRPPQSPTWALGLGWENSWAIGDGFVIPRLDVKAQSAQNFTFWNYDTDLQKGYAWANASLAYEPADGKWRLQLWVRNLTDRTVLTAAEDSQFAGAYRFNFAAPRTVGVKLSTQW
jgi:iron complex outermembrane recepter protein